MPQPTTVEGKVTLLESDKCVTAVSGVNSAVTLTLPAVVGEFHYITAIQIVKHYNILGVDQAAPILVTTTNLPGDPVFTFEQRAASRGSDSIQTIEPTTPIKSSTVNTATTIVCPAQVETSWRVNVWYYEND